MARGEGGQESSVENVRITLLQLASNIHHLICNWKFIYAKQLRLFIATVIHIIYKYNFIQKGCPQQRHLQSFTED